MNLYDEYRAWNTAALLSIARRVTPPAEQHQWTATADKGAWLVSDDDAEMMVLILWGETIRTMLGTDLRNSVIEQLDHYGITADDVNRMKS